MSALKIFFDSNVLISAFAVEGLCSELLERARLKHIHGITSERVLAEVRKNFHKKLKLPERDANENLQLIRESLFVIKDATPHPLASGKCPFDTQDEIILSDALHSGAHLLVTGDREFLQVSKAGSLKLLSPRDLIAKLESKQ